jgi:hypothetical protein
MGRKLIGVTVGFFLTISLAYFLFPPAYNEIIHWLAPYFGPWLRFFLMYLNMYFGNPIIYPTVLLAWLTIGIIAGLFVRSPWGAIGVAMLISTFTFIMMLVGLAAAFLPLILSGGAGSIDFIALFTNIPPDVSVFNILSAPVIGPIMNAITGALGDITGGGMMDPNALLAIVQDFILQTLVVPAVLNFIILAVAAVIGGLIGRTFFPPD